MKAEQLIQELEKTADSIGREDPLRWRYAARTPREPLKSRAQDNWPVYGEDKLSLVKMDKNWFYSEIVFPTRRFGLSLAGTIAHAMIHGWCPFTLWLDGVEMFREERPWMGTGPIAEPLPLIVDPGRIHRLIMCLEPTELPANDTGLIKMSVVPSVLKELAVELQAAALELKMALYLIRNKSEMNRVEKAASRVDAHSLSSRKWAALRTEIAAMEENLSYLSERAKKITVHLIGHCHIDMDWKWTWKDTVQCIRRDFHAVTSLMDEIPDLTFTHSQVSTYDVVRQKDRAVFRKVRDRVAEGRWENTAGTWVEGDLNMANGEAVARHILYASDWTQSHLGSKARVLWEPDTFGHPGNMPQLARLGEFDGYFHMRCNPGGDSNWPMRVWYGIDGTAIPALSVRYNADLEPLTVSGNLFTALKLGLRNAFHVWGIGDHGGGMSRYQIDLLSLYSDKPLVPSFRFSTAGSLLESVRNERVPLPRSYGETYSLFEGCFTTHAAMKKWNRRCEGALISAETLACLADLDRREKLRDGWILALFNQFHDILDGAAVHDSYINAGLKASKSLKIADAVSRESLECFGKAKSNTAGGTSQSTVVTVNSLGFRRTEPVRLKLPRGVACLRDAEGRVHPVQKWGQSYVFLSEDVPAFSRLESAVLKHVPPGHGFSDVSVGETATEFLIETATSVLRMNKKSGVIGSYFDKRLDRDLVAYGSPRNLSHVETAREDLALNVFTLLDEAPKRMSAWLIGPILSEKHLIEDVQMSMEDAGPVMARFKLRYAFRSSKIEEDVIIYHRLPRVDFTIKVDWRERGNQGKGVPQLKFACATSLEAPRGRFEGPFSVMERPTDGLEQPTQRWADITGKEGGFTILNDSRYGCDALGSRLRVTLLRSPYEPDPDPDTGKHEFRLAFSPHQSDIGTGDLVRAGMSFNQNMFAFLRPGGPSSSTANLVLEGADTVVPTSLRRSEHHDGMVLGLFEAGGRHCRARVSLGKGMNRAREVNFLENTLRPLECGADGTVAIRFRPFEVKNLLVNCPAWQK